MFTIQMLNMTFDVWSALFNVILIVGVIASREQNPLQSRPLVGALLANMVVNISEVLAYAFRGDVSPLRLLDGAHLELLGVPLQSPAARVGRTERTSIRRPRVFRHCRLSIRPTGSIVSGLRLLTLSDYYRQ